MNQVTVVRKTVDVRPSGDGAYDKEESLGDIRGGFSEAKEAFIVQRDGKKDAVIDAEGNIYVDGKRVA